jgi:hypothetical protein
MPGANPRSAGIKVSSLLFRQKRKQRFFLQEAIREHLFPGGFIVVSRR